MARVMIRMSSKGFSEFLGRLWLYPQCRFQNGSGFGSVPHPGNPATVPDADEVWILILMIYDFGSRTAFS